MFGCVRGLVVRGQWMGGGGVTSEIQIQILSASLVAHRPSQWSGTERSGAEGSSSWLG